jgi:hypothetical protein
MGGLGFDTLMEEYPRNALYAAFVECCSKTAMKPEEVDAWLAAHQHVHPMAVLLRVVEGSLRAKNQVTPLGQFLNGTAIKFDVQKHLTKMTAKALLDELLPSEAVLRDCSSEERPELMMRYRRLTSLSRNGSLAFLSAIPSSGELIFSDEEFRVALRRILGESLISSGMGGVASCFCGEKLTEKHLQVCLKTYDISRRHNMLRDLLGKMVASVNASYEVEYESPTGKGRCRSDLKATLDGEPKYYDIVTVTPFCQDILDSTNLDPGLPTSLACKAKATHCKEVAKQLPPNAQIISFL